MAIPNIKRFRPFCPTCNESYTLMAVLPKDANVDLETKNGPIDVRDHARNLASPAFDQAA